MIPPLPIKHVRQEDPYGCGHACLAMILGKSYSDVRAELGDPGRGQTHQLWLEMLGRHGHTYQHFFRYNPVTNQPREPWPLQPWAPVHLASVDAGHGPGSHVIVINHDGTVLDPARDTPSRFDAYGGVIWMLGIWPLPQSDQRVPDDS
jgi:hypothetical protein